MPLGGATRGGTLIRTDTVGLGVCKQTNLIKVVLAVDYGGTTQIV